MSNTDLFKRLENMVSATEGISHRDISIGQALKIPLWGYLNECYNKKGVLRYAVRMIRRIGGMLGHIVAGAFWNWCVGVSCQSPVECEKKRFLAVIDHPGHVENMAFDLLGRFEQDEIIVITTSPRIYRRRKDSLTPCLYVYYPVHKWDFRSYWRYYREVSCSVGAGGLLFEVYLLLAVCSVLYAIDYYDAFLGAVKAAGVVTMSDRHWNEYVITMSARKRGILTYTNQHGEFGDLPGYLPIVSEKIFVWGSKSKEYLVQNGVPPQKIVVSGNPKFDRVYSWYLPRRDIIRAEFQKSYSLKPDQPVVTYLSAGILDNIYLYEKAFELFRCFCQAAELPVNLVIKLRHLYDDKKTYRTWLRELNVLNKVKLFQSKDMFDILTISDIAVTSISTAGVEAMGFGIPTIVLNIVDGIDIRDYITFANDAIECKTPTEFRHVLEEMVNKSDRYNVELEKIKHIRKKYFRNCEHFSTSDFVYEHIRSEAMHMNEADKKAL